MSNLTKNTTASTASPTPENRSFSWAVFASRILKAGFALLVFGFVFVVLMNINNVIGDVIPLVSSPIPFAAGSAVLVVLTLLGVEIIPAAAVGVAAWWLIQASF